MPYISKHLLVFWGCGVGLWLCCLNRNSQTRWGRALIWSLYARDWHLSSGCWRQHRCCIAAAAPLRGQDRSGRPLFQNRGRGSGTVAPGVGWVLAQVPMGSVAELWASIPQGSGPARWQWPRSPVQGLLVCQLSGKLFPLSVNRFYWL